MYHILWMKRVPFCLAEVYVMLRICNLEGRGGGASSPENLHTPKQSNVPLSNRGDLTAGSSHVSGYF